MELSVYIKESKGCKKGCINLWWWSVHESTPNARDFALICIHVYVTVFAVSTIMRALQ